ncbi:MAG TPA: hypothetical protein VKZ41_12540 [Gemmatimonadales bacterium]|nr:hypothetical protein [Gemmatimonadales bacterium]
MPETDSKAPDNPITEEELPRGQRFFDNIHLLMVLSIVIMFALYTGWGMWEILTLPPATLP